MTKVSLYAAKSEAEYWRRQPYLARLAALEQIRIEYNQWKYNAQPGFQRVYSIKKNKQASGRAQDIADLENLK